MDSTLTNLSAAQLRRAAELKEQIESLQNELTGLFGGKTSAAPSGGSSTGGKKRGVLSPAAIERIRAAQRARWAAHRAAKGQTARKQKPAGARKMSASARARLAAIARARWAKVKAAGKSAL